MSVRAAAACALLACLAGCGGSATKPESGRAGAGDERGIRVPVTITFRPGGPSPDRIVVPLTLPLEVRLVSADGRGHRFSLGAPGCSATVPAGGQVTTRCPGLPRGRHRPVLDGRRGAVVIVSGAAG